MRGLQTTEAKTALKLLGKHFLMKFTGYGRDYALRAKIYLLNMEFRFWPYGQIILYYLVKVGLKN